jgi:hypothetical protein
MYWPLPSANSAQEGKQKIRTQKCGKPSKYKEKSGFLRIPILVRVFITKLLKILCFTAFKTYSDRALPIKTDNERNMIMEKYITKNGIKYELHGEQYYPMLEISEQSNYEIGKYGYLYLDFIKKYRRGTYTTLLTEGRLNEYLHNIDEQAHEQIDPLITQMAERMGVTEKLKVSDPMRWVQMMNNIKSLAEEIVLKEVVYK